MFAAFILSFALVARPLPQLPASMPAGDAERQLQALVEQYYAAYASEDLPAMEALWHPSGPARDARKVVQAEFEARDAALERVRLFDVAVDAGGGRARGLIELRVTVRGRTRLERRARDLTFLPYAGTWKLWNEASAGRRLASRALTIDPDGLDAAIAAEPELVSDDAIDGLATEAMAARTRGHGSEAMRATEVRLRLARAAGHDGAIASGLTEIGLQHQMVGRYADAGRAFAEARTLVERSGTPRELAAADMNVAAIDYLEGRYAVAIEGYERARRTFEAEGNSDRTAGVLHSLGNAHYMLGEYERALDAYTLAGRLHEKAGSRAALAVVHLASGLVHKELGNYNEAAVAYRTAATLADEVGDPVSAARAWQGLGEVHRLEGDFAAALAALRSSLERWEKTPDVPGRTAALFATGQVQAHLRNFARAVEWYERAIEVDRAIQDAPGIARDLGGLGGAHLAQGRADLAQVEYEESLALREQLRDGRGVTWTLVHLAALHDRASRPADAIRAGQRAVGEAERLGDRSALCTAWAVIAAAQVAGGDLDAALVSAARAASLATSIGQFDVLAHARTVSGRAHARSGRPADAQAAFEEAVEALARVPVGPGADVFFDDRRAPYLALVDLFAGQGRAADAYSWLERGRRHSLAAMLGEGGVIVGKGLTDAEREEELRLLKAWRSAAVKLRREELRDRPDADRQARLRDELASLASARASLRERLFAAHPALRALRAQDDPAAVPAAALGSRQVALAYSIGDAALRLFVVSPPSGEEEAAAVARVDMAAVDITAADLAALVARFREAILARDPKADALAAELHKVLIAPAGAWLAPAREVLVAPDAFLWGLPFEALRAASGRYLIEDVSISYVPSLASAALYREGGRAPARRAATIAAPLVNPPIEDRIAMARTRPGAAAPIDASAEARAVAAVFGAGARLLTGAEATAERLGATAAGGGVLHLAAPVFLNDASPFYSGIVLSPTGPEPGSGLVEAGDLLGWNCAADLAVLSRAEPLQPHPAGDALTAVSWSFLVAGTPALAISRWTPSPSPGRADPLVRAFYREWLRPVAAGMERPSPATVLRRAARRLLAAPATQHPWFWARMMVITAPRLPPRADRSAR